MSVYAQILLHLFFHLKGILSRWNLLNWLQRFGCIGEISGPSSFRGGLMNHLKHLNFWKHGHQDLHRMQNFYHPSQTIVLFCRIVSLFNFFISYCYYYEIMNHYQP